MKNELWMQVDEALNERRDPFKCPALSRALAGDPKTSRAVRLLVDRLEPLRTDAESMPRVVSMRAVPKKAVSTNAVSTKAVWLMLAGAAAALLIAFSVYTRLAEPTGTPTGTSTSASAPRTVKTISLIVSHSSPSPARAQRVVLESQPVIAWSLEGENQ